VLRQKGPIARTPNGGGGGGAAKNESIIIVRIGSSLHIDCHYTYYIIFRHRASPLAVFPHELIPCARVFGHCAQHFSVLSYYMASHAYRRFIFTNKLSSRRVYFSYFSFSTKNRWLFFTNKKIK